MYTNMDDPEAWKHFLLTDVTESNDIIPCKEETPKPCSSGSGR